MEHNINQRDIVLVPFPYSDLTASKQRPALIISNDKLNKTQDRICCLITSNKPKDGIQVSEFTEGTLPYKSWVKPQRLFTINEKIVKKKLCAITKDLHDKVVKEIEEYVKLKH